VYDLLFVYGQIPDPNSERVSAMNTFIQSLAPNDIFRINSYKQKEKKTKKCPPCVSF
jgi:hypothetical protein